MKMYQRLLKRRLGVCWTVTFLLKIINYSSAFSAQLTGSMLQFLYGGGGSYSASSPLGDLNWDAVKICINKTAILHQMSL